MTETTTTTTNATEIAISTYDARLAAEMRSAPWTCPLCGAVVDADERANLFTVVACTLVCDRCGEREAPTLVEALTALRAYSGRYVVGEVPDRVDDARLATWGYCSHCGDDWLASERRQRGPFAVFDADGSMLCAPCAASTDARRLVDLFNRPLDAADL